MAPHVAETWMFPVLDLFSADLGFSILRYRLQRLPAAQARATQFGIPGAAMFPWTSTQSGYGTTHVQLNSTCHGHDLSKSNACSDGLDWTEQHITGDISMAFRLHYRTTHNESFLRESFDLINGSAYFFARRFRQRNDGSANGTKYSISHVTSPDESAGVQDDEVYTNAIGAATIDFALEVAKVLGLQLPTDWAAMAAAPYLPLNTSLPDSNGAQIHPEFSGYAGGPPDCCNRRGIVLLEKSDQSRHRCCITQSAATLMQYPLDVVMSDHVKINDLRYYEPRTRANGFFTGDSIYSIAWLALGNRSAALTQWDAAFAHMDCDHFYLWREELSGGHSNFITGAGGFLQNIIQGWAGLRVQAGALVLRKPTLPPTVESVRLRELQLDGVPFSVWYDAQTITFTLGTSRSSLAILHVDRAGKSRRVVTRHGISFPFATEPSVSNTFSLSASSAGGGR
eukprot:COSAG01_NODE_2241_length_8086_cov_25.173282_6_plen_454_part_00